MKSNVFVWQWFWIFTLIYFLPAVLVLNGYIFSTLSVSSTNPIFFLYFLFAFLTYFFINIKISKMYSSYKAKDYGVAISFGIAFSIICFFSTWFGNIWNWKFIFFTIILYILVCPLFLFSTIVIYTSLATHHSDTSINRRLGLHLNWRSFIKNYHLYTNINIEGTKFNNRNLLFTSKAIYILEYASPELSGIEYNFGIKLSEEELKQTKNKRKSDTKGQSENIINLKNDRDFLIAWFKGLNNDDVIDIKILNVIIYDKEEFKPYFKGVNSDIIVGTLKDVYTRIFEFEKVIEPSYKRGTAIKIIELNRY